MDLRDWLVEGLDYELWANRIWLETLDRFPDRTEPERYFRHIIGAQRTWYDRVVESAAQPPMPSEGATLAEEVQICDGAWRAALDRIDPDLICHWTRHNGQTTERSVGDILRHVLNHGTYHRGQIRQMAEDAGIDFESTDWVYYWHR